MSLKRKLVDEELLADVVMPNGKRLRMEDWNRIRDVPLGNGMGYPTLCGKEQCDFCMKFVLVHDFYYGTCLNALKDCWYRMDENPDTSFLQWLPEEVLGDVTSMIQNTSGMNIFFLIFFE